MRYFIVYWLFDDLRTVRQGNSTKGYSRGSHCAIQSAIKLLQSVKP